MRIKCPSINFFKKRNRVFVTMLTLFFCMVLCFTNGVVVFASATQEVKERWYDTRYYPLHQYNEEWGKHDMLATLDILNPPHDLLLSMPTEELAELMQVHPLMSQITQYWDTNGEQDYAAFYEFMEENSDIFYELLRRKDGFACILEAYRKHEIDVELLNKQDYATVEEASKAYDMWWQEIYGCQFIRHYAHYFTEGEYKLALEVMKEKAEVYKGLSDTNLYYLDLPQVEWTAPVDSPAVRTNYLTEEQIQNKEKILAAALAEIELQKQQEQVSDSIEEAEQDVKEAKPVTEEPEVKKTQKQEKQTGGLPMAGILLGILSIVIGVLWGRKKIKK